MLAWLDSGVHINRLRVRSAGEPIVARVRAERALAGAARRPEALPPQAVLCIRRLADPRPGRVFLQGGRDAPAEWSRAVAERVSDAAARAVRPSVEAVSADTEAVLFADRAELLACLAVDACERRLHSHWWWRSLFGHSNRLRVADVWQTEPRSIAAALDLLATRMRAVPFVRELGPADVHALLAAMLPAHGFAASEPQGDTTVSASPPLDTGSDSESRRGLLSPRNPSSGPPSWHSWAPEASPASGLRVDQRRLLGLALTIRRAPSPVLSQALVAAALEWEETSDVAATNEPSTTDRNRFDTAEDLPPLPTKVAAAVEAAGAPERRSSVEERPDRAATVSDLRRGGGRGARASRASLGDTLAPPRSSEPPASAPLDASPVLGPSLATDVCRAGCGGVLFLLNLGIRLGLYGDFTTPQQPGIALSIWDFATIVGRRLAGPDIDEDPVWNLLATLAHRGANDEPGARFEPPEEWRVSPEWLRPFARVDGVWRWDTSSGRLLVRHPVGFVAVDVIRSAVETAAEQARREVGALTSDSRPRLHLHRWRRTARATHPDRPLVRWSAWLISFVGARLAAAMPGQTARSAGRLLCRLPATVLLTPAHLHVVFPLDALPIEVRLSGLDRDPGWIPAAGRTVTFAFE